MLQDKWFIASNSYMRELHDLKANHTFFNKAWTLVFSRKKVWLGCQDSICKHYKATSWFRFLFPNNNEIAKDCMSEEEKKYYILLNYRFQQMVPRQTVWNVCLQLHFGGQTMKISWYIEKMMCYVKLSLNTSIKEHDFFKFCSTFHGCYFRTSYQKV